MSKEICPPPSGSPQGSVLYPLLFTMLTHSCALRREEPRWWDSLAPTASHVQVGSSSRAGAGVASSRQDQDDERQRPGVATPARFPRHQVRMEDVAFLRPRELE